MSIELSDRLERQLESGPITVERIVDVLGELQAHCEKQLKRDGASHDTLSAYAECASALSSLRAAAGWKPFGR